MEKSINKMLDDSLDNINEIVDSSKVVGEPIRVNDNTTIIPVSKLTYGFGTGGSEFSINKKQNKNDYLFESSSETYPYGGGTLGAVTIVPEAFISIVNGKVELLKIDKKNDFLDMLTNFFYEKRKK